MENRTWLDIDEIIELSKNSPEMNIWCVNMETCQDFLTKAKEIAKIAEESRDKIDEGWRFGKVTEPKDFDDYKENHIPNIYDSEINDLEKDEYYLCYGDPDENILYFSERHAKDNWGDDWDDAPYEHNAGTPYNEDYDGPELGIKNGRGIYNPIDIKEVRFELNEEIYEIRKPCYGTINSSYAVKDINNGAIAWLYIKSCIKDKESIAVNADCTLIEFTRIIKSLGGKLEIKDLEK